jgi:hypothetical protein
VPDTVIGLFLVQCNDQAIFLVGFSVVYHRLREPDVVEDEVPGYKTSLVCMDHAVREFYQLHGKHFSHDLIVRVE